MHFTHNSCVFITLFKTGLCKSGFLSTLLENSVFVFLRFLFWIRWRSSRTDVFCEKGVLRNFTKFTGKHLFQSLFFNKVAGLRPATLLKMWLWHRCFPVIFVKFLRPPLFTEHLRWLLLSMSSLEATYMCIVYCVLYWFCSHFIKIICKHKKLGIKIRLWLKAKNMLPEKFYIF